MACYCSEERHSPPRRRGNGPTASLMGGGGGTSAYEANGGREWLSKLDMTVDGGVEVGL